MPSLYGPRQVFATRASAERFARMLTRELTAGGLAHWVEVQERGPKRWIVFVHAADCAGAAACACR